MSEDERFRAECRFWLDQGYTTPEKVAELIEKIAAERGRKVARQLVVGMRQEYPAWIKRKKAKAGC